LRDSIESLFFEINLSHKKGKYPYHHISQITEILPEKKQSPMDLMKSGDNDLLSQVIFSENETNAIMSAFQSLRNTGYEGVFSYIVPLEHVTN